MKNIKVFAPATVANIACGFDVLGLAINEPGDEVLLKLREKTGLIITGIKGDGGKLPFDPEKNTVTVSIKSFLEYIDSPLGFEVELHKKMPLGSGLGSSAASSVAGVLGANLLLGEPLKRKELLPFAMEGERIACGTAHADNVAPSLLGGIVLIRSYEPLDVIELPVPHDFFCTVLHPHIEVETRYARSILKKEVLLSDAVIQWGNLAGLVAGLFKSDCALIGRSLKDVIAEPVRSLLIPGFESVKKRALKAGVLGCSISGSGPSVFALSLSRQTAERAGLEMKRAFEELRIESTVYVSEINKEGAGIIP